MKITYYVSPRESGKTTFIKNTFLSSPEDSVIFIPREFSSHYKEIPKNKIIFLTKNGLCGRRFKHILIDDLLVNEKMLQSIIPTIEDGGSITIINTPEQLFPKSIFDFVSKMKREYNSRKQSLEIFNTFLDMFSSFYKVPTKTLLQLFDDCWNSILTNPSIKIITNDLNRKDDERLSKLQNLLLIHAKYVIEDKEYRDIFRIDIFQQTQKSYFSNMLPKFIR